MVITINDYNTDRFDASIQIQSSRPVYGSVYGTPIYNFNDKDFNFQYLEFQNFVYNPNQFESEFGICDCVSHLCDAGFRC